MSEGKPDFQMFPQAYLLHYLAYSTPRSGPLDTEKPLGFLDKRIKVSRLGAQNFVQLAKLQGAYMPEALLSKVVSSHLDKKSVSKFFLNLDNHKLSALVPELRLYKVSESGGVKPFYFPVVSDYKFLAAGNSLDLSNSFTSNATAVESFSVTLTGKNPFQASRGFLDADLKVKMDNVASMFDVPSDDYAPVADLFTIRAAGDQPTLGSNKRSPGGALEGGKSCRIIATLGYTTPRGDVFTSKEKKILKTMFQAISLSYSTHDLSMQQDGSATVTVKYTGFLESLKGESQYDLISAIASKTRLQKAKVGEEDKKPKQDLKTFFKGTKSDASQTAKANSTTRDEITLPSVEDALAAFGEIINTLYNTGKIHVIRPDDTNSRKYMKMTSGKNENSTVAPAQAPATAGSNTGAGIIKSDLRSFTEKEVQEIGINPFHFVKNGYISYFAFGDMMDAYYKKIGTDLKKVQSQIETDPFIDDPTKKQCVLKIAGLRAELKRMNVLMADIVYVKKQEDSKRPEQRTINISDISVSIDSFYTAVFEQIIKPRKSFYDMNDFVTSFVPRLLTNSFGELMSADIVNEITFTTTTFTSKPLNSGDIFQGKIFIDDLPSPLLMASKSRAEKLSEYIIIHQEASKHTRSLGSGDEEKDLENGIYHLRANQNSGIIKNITFSRIPSAARETYMIARNGKAYDELRYAHNATLSMVGNNLFFPTVAVYINPESLGFGDPRGADSAARTLGFGGYYSTGPVTTTFSGGSLSTEATLYFESFPDTNSESKVTKNKKKSIKDLKRK